MTKDKRPGGMRRSLSSFGDDDFAYPTSMLFRNLMALDTEAMMRAQPSTDAKPA